MYKGWTRNKEQGMETVKQKEDSSHPILSLTEHDSCMTTLGTLAMAMSICKCQSVDSPFWSRLKYLNNLMDCHEL